MAVCVCARARARACVTYTCLCVCLRVRLPLIQVCVLCLAPYGAPERMYVLQLDKENVDIPIVL